MTVAPVLRFTLAAALVAGIAGSFAGALTQRIDPAATVYTLGGWFAAAGVSIACAAWLAHVLGADQATFLKALAGGMLLRWLIILGSLAWAMTLEPSQWKAWLAGLAAGYLPVQAAELTWFVRGRSMLPNTR